MSAAALLDALRGRGIVAAAVGGKLVVRPATKLTASDRAALRRHLPELVVVLAGGHEPTAEVPPLAGEETWDPVVASRLVFDADALVANLGVDGRHPAVAGAAAAVVSAHATHDLETLRFAVSEFVTVVRGLAAVRSRPK